MTLRARVLLAMGLVAIVVLGGAFLTTQLAEQRLMDQVDRRLVDASGPINRKPKLLVPPASSRSKW